MPSIENTTSLGLPPRICRSPLTTIAPAWIAIIPSMSSTAISSMVLASNPIPESVLYLFIIFTRASTTSIPSMGIEVFLSTTFCIVVSSRLIFTPLILLGWKPPRETWMS